MKNLKIVNMKNFSIRTSRNITKTYNGFGIVNESGKFFSMDGRTPYVLSCRKYQQSVIDSGNWITSDMFVELS